MIAMKTTSLDYSVCLTLQCVINVVDVDFHHCYETADHYCRMDSFDVELDTDSSDVELHMDSSDADVVVGNIGLEVENMGKDHQDLSEVEEVVHVVEMALLLVSYDRFVGVPGGG